mgnify:CR=1 FL=1
MKADSGARDIRERTYEYARRAVRLFRAVAERRDEATLIIGRQYLRAATSIGANMEEAQSAESRADFVHKCAIAQKEVREALYWLRLLRDTSSLPQAVLDPLCDETEQLVKVITAILVKTKKGASAGPVS